jgi:hypothetical protein
VGITLTGYDSRQVVVVKCLLPNPAAPSDTPCKFNLSFAYPHGKYPEDIEDAMQIVARMAVGDYLTILEGKRQLAKTHPITDVMTAYRPVAETVIALARLQEHTGERFVVPEGFTGHDRLTLTTAASLLPGPAVVVPWRAFNVVIGSGRIRDALEVFTKDHGAGALLIEQEDVVVEFAGHEIGLGTLRVWCRCVEVRNLDELLALADTDAEPTCRLSAREGDEVFAVLVREGAEAA